MLQLTASPTKTYPYRISNGKSNDGMWVVLVGSDEYRAWKYWLHHETGKNFFPEPTMQVWFQWPPGTQAFADQVAKAISDIRDGDDAFRKLKDGTHPPIGGAAVPQHPRPWDGYIPDPPVEEPIISADAMRMIRERLEKNWVGRKGPSFPAPTGQGAITG